MHFHFHFHFHSSYFCFLSFSLSWRPPSFGAAKGSKKKPLCHVPGSFHGLSHPRLSPAKQIAYALTQREAGVEKRRDALGEEGGVWLYPFSPYHNQTPKPTPTPTTPDRTRQGPKSAVISPAYLLSTFYLSSSCLNPSSRSVRRSHPPSPILLSHHPISYSDPPAP
jgi:hypothetical protein